jgi:hypothetical protein
MEPMAPRRNTRAVSIALIFVSTLAPRAYAQFSSSPAFGNADAASGAAATRQPLLTYGVDAGIGETDNVNLSSTDKVSQTIAITDVDFAVNEQSRLLVANAKGDFSYLDYVQGAYGPQLLGRFDGTARLAIVPGRLTWVVQDNFGQAALDPYTAVTPSNMQNINYFATGPELSLRLGPVNFMNLGARYSRAQYGSEPFDNNGASAYVNLGRYIAAGASISVNAETEKVLFDNTAVNTDFELSSAFARYQLHGARTDFEADLGASTVENSAHTTVTAATGDVPASSVTQPAHSDSGPLAKLQLSRLLSPAAKITLTVGRELTDPSSSFSTLQGGAIGIVGTAGAVQTSGAYTTDFGSAIWQYTLNRTSIGVGARWEKDTYPSVPLDDLRTWGADFSVQRRLTRALTAQLVGRLSKANYLNADVATATASSNYKTGMAGGSLIWRHGRGLEIKLSYDYNSWVVTGPGAGYRQNGAFLTVGYRPYRALPEDLALAQ